MTGYLAGLTRPELDALMSVAQTEYERARDWLGVCPATVPVVHGAAGVAADLLGLWDDAVSESVLRLLMDMEALP